MTCSIRSRICLGVLLSALAQLPLLAAAEDGAFPSEPVIPERDLAFEESDEPYSMKLFAADPRLLEQKYVALVRFEVPLDAATGRLPVIADDVQRMLQAALGVGPQGRDGIPASIKQLVENTAPQWRPDNTLVSLLSDPKHLRLGGVDRSSGKSQIAEVKFLVLGSDIDDVKAKALALINLYDYGLSYPIQESLIAEMQQYKQTQQEAAMKRASEQSEIERLQETLEQYEPISREMIDDLKTQQRLVSVDIAGVKARIDACSSILKRGDVRDRPIAEQVESTKVSAEIELVGLMARKDALDEIVQQGTNRFELEEQLAAQKKAVTKLRNTIVSNSRAIMSVEATRAKYLPFPLHENEILIYPVKWESGD